MMNSELQMKVWALNSGDGYIYHANHMKRGTKCVLSTHAQGTVLLLYRTQEEHKYFLRETYRFPTHLKLTFFYDGGVPPP